MMPLIDAEIIRCREKNERLMFLTNPSETDNMILEAVQFRKSGKRQEVRDESSANV